MTTKISFEEFKKRKRPEQVCIKCGEHKEIYTHLNGEEDKPLCNTCNMKLRRNSPGAIQVKLLKLCATTIGSVEAMLGLPVEEKQKKNLQDMQDELKLMIRVWLGDTQADEEANATTSTQEATDAPTGPASDEFAEARTTAVSETADNLFEAPKSAPASRKGRKALIAAKVEQREAAKSEANDAAPTIATPNNPTGDPAYQEYLEGGQLNPKSKAEPAESAEDITETTPHGYFAKFNRKSKQESQPWEIFLSIDGAKPKFCCRERSRQDAEARCWKLDRMAEEEEQTTSTATASNQGVETAAM